jgi:protoporphyrinogen IX oxidase
MAVLLNARDSQMLWVKAFHIIAIVCWFSGIFYLPRLFVYHAMSEDQISKDRFVIMERKLFWGITTPSAIATIALGTWLLVANASYFMAMPWMHIKLALVALVVAFHIYCWWFMKALREDSTVRTHKFFRVFNELPVFMLVGIVILVVVKPTF